MILSSSNPNRPHWRAHAGVLVKVLEYTDDVTILNI